MLTIEAFKVALHHACVDRACIVFLESEKLRQLQNYLLARAALISDDSEKHSLGALISER
jgi:hypothetical protein